MLFLKKWLDNGCQESVLEMTKILKTEYSNKLNNNSIS